MTKKKNKFIIFFIIFFVYKAPLFTMENKPYHHLSDGTFRNPEGSPMRDMKFNWSYKIFNKEKKKTGYEYSKRPRHRKK